MQKAFFLRYERCAYAFNMKNSHIISTIHLCIFDTQSAHLPAATHCLSLVSRHCYKASDLLFLHSEYIHRTLVLTAKITTNTIITTSTRHCYKASYSLFPHIKYTSCLGAYHDNSHQYHFTTSTTITEDMIATEHVLIETQPGM